MTLWMRLLLAVLALAAPARGLAQVQVQARPAAPMAAPAAAPQPLRLLNGPEVWTISDAALRQFVARGTFGDQRLLHLVLRSGWPEDALRTALVKPYAVDFAAMAAFLDSPAGLAFLQQQSRAYRPLPGGAQVDRRAVALRAAILADARDGTISALGLVRNLPVPLLLDVASPGLHRCSSIPCATPQQCRSLLSWLVFLPACLQAAAASPA